MSFYTNPYTILERRSRIFSEMTPYFGAVAIVLQKKTPMKAIRLAEKALIDAGAIHVDSIVNTDDVDIIVGKLDLRFPCVDLVYVDDESDVACLDDASKDYIPSSILGLFCRNFKAKFGDECEYRIAIVRDVGFVGCKDMSKWGSIIEDA
jgi:hypothetical protein